MQGGGRVWVGCSSARQATTCACGGRKVQRSREAVLDLKPHPPLPLSLDGGGVGAGRLLVVPLRVRPDKLLDQAQGLQPGAGRGGGGDGGKTT